MRFALITTASAGLVLLLGCSEGSVTEGTTPAVQSKVLEQLSAGGGIAGYDFYIDANDNDMLDPGERIAALLVTHDVYGGASDDCDDPVNPTYCNETEYWRWEAGSLANVQAGSVPDINVDFVGTSDTVDPVLIDNFELGTGTWTAWEVNREFELDSNYSMVWNAPPNQVLFRLEAAAWGSLGEKNPGMTITYFHLMDFTGSAGYPELSWLISAEDFHRWQDSEASDDDDGSIYEVRLTSDTVLEQTAYGFGYELTTVK